MLLLLVITIVYDNGDIVDYTSMRLRLIVLYEQ